MAGADGTRTDPTAHSRPVRLPVIKGDRWFDSEYRQFILCVEYPLSAEEMVAALYGVVEPGDIASDEDLCGSVAVRLSIEGLPGLRAQRFIENSIRRNRVRWLHGTSQETCEVVADNR